MEAANIVVIVMGVILGIILLVGISQLIRHYFSQHSNLTPYDQSARHRQALKTIFTILISVLVFAAVFFAYHYFVNR